MGKIKDNCLDSNKNEFIIRGQDTGYLPEPKGIGYAYYYYMMKNRNLIAQIDAVSGVKDTYGNLLKRCVSTALKMKSRGITAKDVITVCSFNNLNSCVPIIAALFLGAKPASLDPALSTQDVIHLIKQVHPKMAFVGPEAVDLIENAFVESNIEVEIVVFDTSKKHREFSEFCSENNYNNFSPIEVINNNDTAMIFFSSGTTGFPKGICLSHKALLGQAYILVYQGVALDLCSIFASTYWISSICILTACIIGGGARLVFPRFSPQAFWKLISQFKVTMAFLAPSQAISVYKMGRPENIDTTNFADFLIGGGPISAKHVQEIRDIFPGTNCSIIYGQTEAAGLVLNFDRNLRQHILWMHQKPGSTGTIVPDSVCKVVDPETDEMLGPNRQGELRIKSDNQLNGYYGMNSSDIWDSQGWLKTGDVVYYDEDRCFYIVDRIKQLLKFQSFHVPPAVIEDVLMTHPQINTAVVIGLPHEEDGDHPLAIVTLKHPNDVVDPKYIEKYVEERMDDRYRLRGGVKIVDSLPMTATGKIKRNDLRKMVLENK